jgi:hypothetical protein
LATGGFTDVVGKIVQWVDAGYMELDEEETEENAFLKWKRRQTIFLHSSPKRLADMDDVTFDYGLTGFPKQDPLILEKYTTISECLGQCDSVASSGSFSSTLKGTFIGVYKHSKNIAGALRVVEALTSQQYQEALLSEKKYQRWYLSPIFPSSIQKPEFCEAIGSTLCEFHNNSIPSVVPSTLAKNLYPNVTEIVKEGLLAIFKGEIDVSTGVDSIDMKLRGLLNIPAFNSTEDDPFIIAKPKTVRFKNLSVQLLILFMVIGVTLCMVLLHRRKKLKEIEFLERKELLEQQDSLEVVFPIVFPDKE